MRLSVLLLTTLLPACWSPTPPPPPPGFARSPSLDVPGGVTVLDLRRLPAAWTPPDADAAPRPEPPTEPAPGASPTFVLPPVAPASGPLAERLGATWQAPLPFELPASAIRFRPVGMRVVADGRPLPWALRPRSGEGWRIGETGQLLLSLDQPPARIVVEHPGLSEHLARLDPRASGLSPADHARYTLTLDQETREGLLVPRGASGAWDLTLPEGARFEAEVGMVEDRLPATEAPARLGLWITPVGQEAVQVATQEIDATTAAFSPWNVDLAAFGGQEVRLSLIATGDPGGDVPFVAHPVVVGAPEAGAPPPRRIVWIGLDTTRRDRLGLYGYDRPTSPALDAWAEQAVVYDNAVTPAPRTRPSFRSALTGKRPLDAVGAPTVLARLDAAGFATAGIVANIHLNARFGFPEGADRWSLDPSARAEDQVDDAIAWLDVHADRDAALFLHIMDPHLAYLPPADLAERFVRDPVTELSGRFVRSDVYRWMRDGTLDDRGKAWISDLYDAEIAATDRALGRLFAHLDGLPGRTVVIVHSDHGEELWDHGGFEHNHSLKPELHDAVMLLRAPGLPPGRRELPATLMDLAPTLLDLLDLPGADLDGRSLLEPVPPDRPRDLGHLMYDTERWGVRAGPWTYLLWTASGREALYDRRVDPGEHEDLVEAGRADPAVLADLRARLAEVHGAEVGPGWRVKVALAGELVALDLPEPALGVGVLDPEASRPYRANQAWGEPPRTRPEQVAAVRLTEDRRRVLIVPGSVGEGILWIRFGEHVAVSGLLRSGGEQHPLVEGADLSLPGVRTLTARAGTLILPPPGEAARMRALAGAVDQVDPADSALLQRLGYLRDGDGAEDAPHSGAEVTP